MLDWKTLEQHCEACQQCSLYKTRNHLVFGGGNKNAKLMFIGEGPGAQEDATGIPFVGKSGQLLDKILNSVNINRTDVYIANIIKCHPPNNRDPQENEKKACLHYLRNQVYLIQPKIIVCLGRVAAQVIINPNFKITKEHGIWFERKGYYLMGTYHPSALLRDPSKKRDSWEDFKKIREKLDAV